MNADLFPLVNHLQQLSILHEAKSCVIKHRLLTHNLLVGTYGDGRTGESKSKTYGTGSVESTEIRPKPSDCFGVLEIRMHLLGPFPEVALAPMILVSLLKAGEQLMLGGVVGIAKQSFLL